MHGPTAVFDRVACGVDPAVGSLDAARLAARVADPGGSLTLVAVADAIEADEARAAADRARTAASALHDAVVEVVEGGAADGLLRELERIQATLAVVGGRGHSRVSGVLLGSVASRLLHDAPCSVLLARPAPAEPAAWPTSIVVGLDGSVTSARAAAAAWELADRCGAEVRSMVATRGAEPDVEAARRIAPELELVDERPLAALRAASQRHDLVVVGSRGLTGLRALGSVSERLGHEARCPVLVVRER